MKSRSLIILCLFAYSFLPAQKYADENQLLLTTGEVEFAPNLNDLIQGEHDLGEPYDSRHFTFIQFNETPTSTERAGLSQMGIELLEYIPHKAYLASLPEDFNYSSLIEYDVRGIYALEANHKLHPKVQERPFPEFAMHKNKVELYIQIHKGIELEAIKGQLRKNGAEVILERSTINSLHIIIDPKDIDALASEAYVRYIQLPLPPPEKEDTRGRSLHRSNALTSEYGAGRKYSADGVNLAVNDDGQVGPHIDFQGRLDQTGADNFGGAHGDMVAGIAGGAGNLDPRNAGMAFGAKLFIRDYNQNLPGTATLHQEDSVMIFSTSYSNGCNAGYTLNTQLVDMEIRENPALIQVFSAGNSNGGDCGYGAGGQWGNITGGHKQAKSCITTANLEANDSLVLSSSRGPAHDGRIKPDIAANGRNQISTDPDNTYAPGGGTSAAAPGIAGCLAQLYQAYRDLNDGENPESALLKACVLNTAYDLGNEGPDYKYGWGRIDALKAVRILEDERYVRSSVDQGEEQVLDFVIEPGVREARIMLYWADPEAATGVTRALVNDLDLLVGTPDLQTIMPLVLDETPNPNTLDLPAQPDVDDLNNVEQVRLYDPTPGSYTARIDASNIPFGPQPYFVVYEYIYDNIEVTYPLGGEGFVPGEFELIRWDAYGDEGEFLIEYTLDSGMTWMTIAENIPGHTRTWEWQVPFTVSHQALIRVSRDGLSDTGEEVFNVVAIPPNFLVGNICDDRIILRWDSVPGVDDYEVLALGEKYMEPIITSTNGETFAEITGIDVGAVNWFAVRSINSQGLRGRRSVAIRSSGNLLNCTYMRDAAALDIILRPDVETGTLQTCIEEATVILAMTNSGLESLADIMVSYQLNEGPIITEPFSQVLHSGQVKEHVFAEKINLQDVGDYEIKVWVSTENDELFENDSLSLDWQFLDLLDESQRELDFQQSFLPYNWYNSNPDMSIGWGW